MPETHLCPPLSFQTDAGETEHTGINKNIPGLIPEKPQ